MAPIVRGILRDEAGPPARHEVVLAVERAETREERVDHPQLVIGPGQLVTVDRTGIQGRPCQVTGVVRSRRIELRCYGGQSRRIQTTERAPMASRPGATAMPIARSKL